MNEKWKPVDGFEGFYEVSDSGDIRNKDGAMLSPYKGKGGYIVYDLRGNGKRKMSYLHRILAKAFILNPNNSPFINHKDGNKTNNDLNNLEWCTAQENMDHAIQTGLFKPKPLLGGEDSIASKLTWEKVRYIRSEISNGRTHLSLAKELGVSKGTIGFIHRKETWKERL